jgi:hypothetical protein
MNTKIARAGKALKGPVKKKLSAGYVMASGAHSLAFGLLWDRVAGAKLSRSAISNAAKKYAASTYVALPAVDNKRVIGLLADSATVEKEASRKGAVSAAALLATAYPGIANAVFGVALPGGKVAFMGFRSGAPLIGFDRIVSREVLDELTADFLKEFDEISAPSVQFYGAADIFVGRTVNDFDVEWFDTLPKRTVSAARLCRAKAPTALLIAIVAAAGLAYGATEWYADYQRASLKKAVPVAVDPQVLYEKSATEYLATAVAGQITAAPMTDKINRLPLYHQGWRLEKASCTPDTCTLSWTNSDGGTYQSFASSPLPGVPVYQTAYKEGMTGLETTFTVKNDAPKGFRMAELPKQDQFVLFFGSKAQEMKGAGLAITLVKGAVVAMPTAPAGAPPITEAELKEKVVEGTWSMTGDWTFYQALASLPGNMTVEKVEVSVSGDSMAMSVMGKYYVKN